MLRSGTVYNPRQNKDNNLKMEFNNWKQKVDKIIYAKLKIHCNDLPDEDYWVMWDQNITPKIMANFILKNNDDFKDDMMDVLKEHIQNYNL
jgi:hypothetical protein